ncbi:MAG: acyl dehydratase [Porticoccaceae bacterium]|nr:acyl dehydratase [Porticoccaceae bacterium]
MNKLNNSSTPDSDDYLLTAQLERLPSMAGLFGKAAFKTDRYQLGQAIPLLGNSVDDVYIDQKHLRAYQVLCGFPVGEKLPATYLSMLTFPMVLSLMTHAEFPMKAMGQVHLANKITVHKSFDVRQPMSLCSMIGESQVTSRGLEWTVEGSVKVDNKIVWSCISTMLHRCKTDIDRELKTPVMKEGAPQDWLVKSNMGRRYAKVSGDYNPIHLADVTAKLFGFKRAIVHGMWSKARCLAMLTEHLPDDGYTVDVNFHRPLFLPSKVLFYTKQNWGQTQFSLFNQTGEHAHLEGSMSQDLTNA